MLTKSKASVSWFARKQTKELMFKLFAYIILLTGSCVFFLPFFWMISTSLKIDTQIFLFPPKWIPNPVKWQNYYEVLSNTPFLIWLRNTTYVTALNVLGVFLSCPLVAYSFARLEWRGRNVCFIILISTMMLPPQVTMVPVYLLFKMLGWVETFKPLYIRAFFGFPFYIFLLRQFFKTIPRELEEAAMIDGCTPYGIYWKIILPLVKPALATVIIFNFMASWNNFLGPLIYLHHPEMMTLALGLQYFEAAYEVDWSLLMGAAVMMTAPIIAVFFFFQKYFVRGIVLTGIKG